MAADRQYKHELNRDVFTLKKGDTVLATWPELAEYPDLVKHGSAKNDLLLRYCILLTDAGSGYLTIANVELRHEKAWAAAGLSATDARMAGAFDFSDEGVAAMCYALLEADDSMMLAYVLAAEAVIWQDIKDLRKGGADKMDGLPGRIRNLQVEKKNLFSGDKALEESVKTIAKSSQYSAESLARETPVIR